jgi:hypothetical protein
MVSQMKQITYLTVHTTPLFALNNWYASFYRIRLELCSDAALASTFVGETPQRAFARCCAGVGALVGLAVGCKGAQLRCRLCLVAGCWLRTQSDCLDALPDARRTRTGVAHSLLTHVALAAAANLSSVVGGLAVSVRPIDVCILSDAVCQRCECGGQTACWCVAGIADAGSTRGIVGIAVVACPRAFESAARFGNDRRNSMEKWRDGGKCCRYRLMPKWVLYQRKRA